MNLQDTYNYLKDRYGITHSFSTFKKNAETKGLDQEDCYLELIVSVLVGMNRTVEGVLEIKDEINALNAEESIALEEHIRSLELRNETLEQRAADAEKDAEGAEKWLTKANATNLSNRQLIKSLRDKNDTLKSLYETENHDRIALQKEGIRLNIKLNKKVEYSAAADKKIESMRKGMLLLNEDRNDWKGVAIARRKVIDTKRVEIGSLNRELYERHLKIKELEKEVDSLKHKSILSKLKKVFGKGV